MRMASKGDEVCTDVLLETQSVQAVVLVEVKAAIILYSFGYLHHVNT